MSSYNGNLNNSSIPNYDSSIYNEHTYTSNVDSNISNNKKQLTFSSSRILSWSLLWFALGFLLVAGLGSLWIYLITGGKKDIDQYNWNGFYILWTILGISLIGSFIASFFTSLSRRTNSMGSSIFSFVFYTLMFSGMFAAISIVVSVYLFPEGKQNNYLVLTAFAITGGLTLLSGLIAAGLSLKGILTLAKAITIIMCVLLFGNIIIMCCLWFMSNETINIYYYVYDALFCVVMVMFMIITFYKIINFSNSYGAQKLSKAEVMHFGIAFGTEILINFMIIFMYIIRLLLRRD